MTFWQENYGFIKDVYDMRHQKMMEWMENVERVSFKNGKMASFNLKYYSGNWQNHGG